MNAYYGEARGRSRLVVRLYRNRFPHRRVPSRTLFQRVHERLHETGTLLPRRIERGPQRPHRIINIEEEVLETVEEQPGISLRRLAQRFHVSHWTIWRTLREQLLYPYNVQRVQALRPADYPRRVAFCTWFLRQVQQDADFPRYILATDEAGFTREGIFNYHNTHVWADENPHAIQPRHFQWQFAINLWASIVDDRLIGPFELLDRLTGANCLQFLRHNLPQLLEEVPLDRRGRMWFLHDGAPAHFSRMVRRFLDGHYTRRWIGRGGPQAWPARSPDLTPLDFYLWGHLKKLVYGEEITSEQHLRHGAVNTMRANPGNFERVRYQWVRRAQACIEMNGRHFEHFM